MADLKEEIQTLQIQREEVSGHYERVKVVACCCIVMVVVVAAWGSVVRGY